jgi:hypothetical protein
MAYVDFINKLHKSTKRDYLKRVTDHDKAAVAEIACRFDKDYWDGERHLGYGGYKYDGRWRVVAEDMAKHYNLKPGAKILDYGVRFTKPVVVDPETGADLHVVATVGAVDDTVARIDLKVTFGETTVLVKAQLRLAV